MRPSLRDCDRRAVTLSIGYLRWAGLSMYETLLETTKYQFTNRAGTFRFCLRCFRIKRVQQVAHHIEGCVFIHDRYVKLYFKIGKIPMIRKSNIRTYIYRWEETKFFRYLQCYRWHYKIGTLKKIINPSRYNKEILKWTS